MTFQGFIASMYGVSVVDQYANVNGDRPKALPIPKVVDTIAGIRYVFQRPTQYVNTYVRGMALVTEGYGFMLSFDDEKYVSIAAFGGGVTDMMFTQAQQRQGVGGSHLVSEWNGVAPGALTNVQELHGAARRTELVQD